VISAVPRFLVTSSSMLLLELDRNPESERLWLVCRWEVDVEFGGFLVFWSLDEGFSIGFLESGVLLSSEVELE